MAKKPEDPQPAIAVEPRYAREMPWVLILIAAVVAIFAGVMQQRTSVDTRVTVAQVTPASATKAKATSKPATRAKATTKSRQGNKPAAQQQSPSKKKKKSKSAVATSQPKVTKITTTEKRPSDTLLGVLFGLAGVFAVAGAFYARVSKVTLPGGGGLELGAATVDVGAIAKAVAETVKKEIEKKPPAEREAFDTERVAALSATATARAQAQALQLRAAAIAAPVVPVAVEAPEVTRAQRGMPLSDDLVKRLAENAVQEALAEPEQTAE